MNLPFSTPYSLSPVKIHMSVVVGTEDSGGSSVASDVLSGLSNVNDLKDWESGKR